ncbi:hypothetical protein ACMFWY_21530, partial [Roseiconus sp. JC912]|uniref:hypothetical protein n=2 Tax=Pirellulaceae TaxID=2691357 RepID=UPI003A4C5B4A
MRLIGGQKVKKAKAKSRLRKLRRLLAESLEDRNMLAAISWDGGGGDLRWSNSLNWSSDRLPTASDDVSIDAGNEAIEIRSGTHSVRSIDLNSDLQIENARLFTEGFAIAPGSTLVVEGANSEFVANAATAIDGANFVASSNGMLTVGSVTTVSNTFGDMYWRATGAGSVLSFPDLKTINNGTGRNWDTFLESFQGGKLDLGAVTEIIDPNSGDLRQRSVQVKAEGVGSEVDLSSLQNFVDYAGYATSDSDGEYSRLHATLGGHIKLSELSIVRGVYFPVDSTGTIDLSTITSLSHGLVEAGRSVDLSALESGYSTDFVTSGPDIDLSNLHDADHAVFTIDGRDLNLDSVESIDGASFYVSGGVSIEIPSVTTVSNTYGDVYWRVTGSGSVLSFPNLTSVNNGTGRNWDAFLESLQGGKLDLGRVTEIIDPNSGDLRQRSVQVKAEGVGSEVDLSSLQNFVDYAGYATSDSDGEYSRLHATQGGLVNLGALSTVRGVYFPVDVLGTIDLSTITSLSHGLVEAGRSVDLSALESGYSTDFVTSGPDIDLSNLRDADHAV